MNIDRVLLTGGRSPVALHLARMLAKEGVRVHMAESERYPLSKYSKAITQHILVPKPNEAHDKFIEALILYCKKESIQRIIPTCEEIFHLARAKTRFEQHGIAVFCEQLDTLHMLHNKYTFNRYLQTRGFCYPDTQQFTSQQELEHFLQQATSPYVLKASYSRFASHVYIVKGLRELPRITISPSQPWVLQRYIEGEQYCSYSVAKNGELLAHTCYPSRYTAGLGANVFFLHREEPKIQNFVRIFVKQLNFTGQIAFDFIRAADGAFYPLECNPRATSGLHLFDCAPGFAELFTNDAPAQITPTASAHKLGLPMLLYGVTGGALWRNPRAFMHDFYTARDVIYRREDKAPSVYQLVYLVALLIRKIKTGKSLAKLTTMDIEWDGEQ